MNLDSIYKNRPYLYETNKDFFSENSTIIEAICKKSGLKNARNFCFIATNYHCDIYRADTDDGIVCIKYSFDYPSMYLEKEIDILKKLNAPNTPEPITFGEIKFGDKLSYSITSFENAENLQSAGASNMLLYPESFINSFDLMSRNFSEDGSLPNLSEYIEESFKKTSFDLFPEESKKSIDEHIGISLVQSVGDSLKKEILSIAEHPNLNKKEFCHGNLKPSNILFRGGQFKFVNFHSCFVGNRLLDLSLLFACSIAEREYKSSFIEKAKNLISDVSFGDFELCNKVMIRKLFFDLFMSYLQEVYVFESFRPVELVLIADIFTRNSKNFLAIDCIRPYYDQAFKAIATPIIGSK